MFNILLVDDEVASIEYLSKTIEDNYTDFLKVEITNSVAEAKTLLFRKNYDLIVCDVNMPDENGIEFMNYLIKTHSKLKIVMLSGYQDFQDLYEIQKNNVRFISKLESVDYIIQIIQEELMGMKPKPKELTHKVLIERSDMISYIIEFINKNFKNDLSLDYLAEMLYIHPSYLSRIFKKSTGVTLFEYINNVRITEAKKLLLNTNMLVSDIYQIIGYNSISYFNQVFKIRVGVTPQQYRRQSIPIKQS